jgi:hypothetical protein
MEAPPTSKPIQLPRSDTKRWTARRKAALVAAVASGALSSEEACNRYSLTAEEFLIWQLRFEQYGVAGLEAKKIRKHRVKLRRPPPSSPS